MRLRLILFGILLVAGAAYAADTVISPNGPPFRGCLEWTLCDDQTTLGNCLASDGNNAILRADAEWFWSICGDTSDQTSGWTAEVYKKTKGAGYGTVRAHITYLGALTPTNPCIDWSGHGGDLHAVLAGTLTNGVTLVARGCEP